jgi:hypothetical protein
MTHEYKNSRVARIMKLNVASVNRYLKDGYKPFKTDALYFSDLKRDKNWFYGI